MKKPLLLFFTTLLLLCIPGTSIYAQSHKISGTVKDELNNENLIGANVLVDQLFIGAATDVDGKFEVYGIPDGPFTLIVKFIGYEEQIIKFDSAPTTPITIKLKSSSIMGDEFVVTALARGQMGAINTQLNALQIKSVVSAAKMDEIPDATAAEAIGRLPGLTIERSGGEANKVSVRGLGSKHNTMSVEGVTLLSTDSENRSVDISMIAPNVLSGVSVTKALTSDMIASSLGGAVDMTLKTAQEGGLSLDAAIQGGYNSNISALSDYKASLAVGNRILDNKLGIMFGGYVENRYRGKDVIDANWIRDDRKTIDVDSTLRLNNMKYTDIEDNRFRFGGSLVLDYQLPFGQIKLINFGSRMNLHSTTYSQTFGVISDNHSYSTEVGGDDFRTQMVNKIAGEFDVFTGKLSVGFSHSMAERDNPERLRVGAWGDYRNNKPISDVKYRDSLVAIPNFDFREWVNYINRPGEDPTELNQAAANAEFIKNYGMDREYTTQIDYELPFHIGNSLSGLVKAGYMHKKRYRKYDYNQAKVDVASSGINHNVDAEIRKEFPEIYVTDPAYQGKLHIQDAWSDDFDQNTFYGGDYRLFPFMDLDHMRDYANFGRQYYEDNNFGLYQNIASYQKDQDGEETYDAGYVMAEIKFWKDRINVIPGIRYERQTYDYKAKVVQAPFGGSAANLSSYVSDTTSGLIEHVNFFPSIQTTIRPTKWLDIRLAYNKTVSRPDFIDIIPRYSYDPNTTPGEIQAGNTNLRPQISDNLDAQVSFHGNKFGLLTLGVYRKNIVDLIEQNTYLILDTAQANYHGLPHDIVSKERGGKANYEYSLNNKWDMQILGFEADYQPNLHFLPYPFNGLLANVNLSFNDFKYERYTDFTYKVKTPLFPGSPIKVDKDAVRDTSYKQHTQRLTLNASLGYNYRGFTVHLSYLYKPSNIRSLGATRSRPTDDLYNFTYHRFDLKMKQKLSHGFELFLNVNNLTNSGDSWYHNVAGSGDYYIDEDQRYGQNVHLGIRYRL